MQNLKTKLFLVDSAFARKEKNVSDFLPDFYLARLMKKHGRKSVLFSKYGKTDSFYTDQSGFYFTQKDLEKIRRGKKMLSFSKKMDCILPADLKAELKNISYKNNSGISILEEAKKRSEVIEKYWQQMWSEEVLGAGLSRAWSVSVVFSVIFGMFLMTMLYRYLGQSASARTKAETVGQKQVVSEVLGDEDKKEEERITQELLAEYQELLKKGKEKEEIAGKIREMTKGYPIEKMAGEISKKDKIIAAFLVGIAMKESTWGKHVPVLDGKDCYNYWGYRGKRERMGTGGHTCFDSPKDAVDTVSKRIEFLVKNEKITTPEKMVTVWKCGYDCSWDEKKNVQKWIRDVDKYFDEFNKKAEDQG